MDVSLNIPSPIDSIEIDSIKVIIDIKREDQIHPYFGGNKWRKLKYNLEHFKENSYSTLVSFGGAFSNHIHALANAACFFGYPSVGIIRGDGIDPDNPSLRRAKDCGMELHSVSREEYRLKENSTAVKDILSKYERPYLIPEGGSNSLAKKGVAELIDELDPDIGYDKIFVASGTGMTAAGLIEHKDPKTELIAVNVLKNKSLDQSIRSFLEDPKDNWSVSHDYHFGAYAKVPVELREFYHSFYDKFRIELDPIYTVKMMYAIFDMIEKGLIRREERILAIHTGGIQGIQAYEYMKNKIWTPKN